VEYNEDAFDDNLDDNYKDSEQDDDNNDLPEQQFEENDPDKVTDVKDGDNREANSSEEENSDNDDDNQGGDKNLNQDQQGHTEQEETTPSTGQEETNDGNQGKEEKRIVTRSGRVSRPPARLTFAQHLITQAHHNQEEYTVKSARVIARTMCYINNIAFQPLLNKKAWQFVQTYGLIKGWKKFGKKGQKAAFKEMKQLHDRIVFKPTHVSKLTNLERQI
jgi:hypothetical protein